MRLLGMVQANDSLDTEKIVYMYSQQEERG